MKLLPDYICNCTPTQAYPHIVKTPHVNNYWKYSWLRWFGISLQRRLHPAKSCDNHPVPVHKWCLRLWNTYYEFGEIIY